MREEMKSVNADAPAAWRTQLYCLYTAATVWQCLLGYCCVRINIRYQGFIDSFSVDTSYFPALSRWTVRVPWWPFLFAGCCLVGLAIAVKHPQCGTRAHHRAMMSAFWIETAVMACTLIGYVMPLGAAAPLF